MLDTLRKPLFVVAMLLIVVAWLLEMGSGLLIGRHASLPPGAAGGVGVVALAALDALVILTVGLMGLALFLPERLHGRVQGVVTLLVALAVFIAGLLLLFAAIGLITLMLGLLLAPIFGTVAYFVVFGSFDRGGPAAVLALLMLLKLAFAAMLLLAHQRFLENKGLVLLVASSLVAVLVVSFLHALVPGPLVSITDALAAIVVLVLALIWAVIFIVGALVSIIKAVV